MAFLADSLGGWLAGLLAEAHGRMMTDWVFGREQERAVRQAAMAAVQLSVGDLSPDDDEQADLMAIAIREAFSGPETEVEWAQQATLLEMLRGGIAERLAEVEDDDLSSTDRQPAEVSGVPVAAVAAGLTGHLLREIMFRGSASAPLEPLAVQLNHDAHLQGQRLETLLGELAEQAKDALAESNAPEVTELRAPGQLPRSSDRLGVQDGEQADQAERGSQTQEVRAVEVRIARELARLVDPQRLGAQLVPPVPYIRRHAVEHAAAGGVLDERFLTPEFLPYVDATRLRRLDVARGRQRRDGSGMELADRFRAWRQLAHCWEWDEPSSNADAYEYWMAGIGNRPRSDIATAWRTRWRYGSRPGGELVARHAWSQEAVACTVLAGRPVAVIGSLDGIVRIWDLVTGKQVGGDIVVNTKTVTALAAAVRPDGHSVALICSAYGSVKVWDLTAAEPIGDPPVGDLRLVNCAAATVLPDGRAIGVTGNNYNTLRRWDLATGAPIGEPLTVPSGSVNAVAVAVLPEGRLIAITGGTSDHAVQIWDLAAGRQIGEPLTGHNGWVNAVAVSVLPDGRLVAVTGSGDHTVRIWDLAARVQIGDPLIGHDGAVTAVATAVLPDGRPIAVTGSEYNDGEGPTVRIWDLAAARAVGSPLAGNTGAVTALATAVMPDDGHPVAVTGASDGSVRFWDLVTSIPAADRMTGLAHRVYALAAETPPNGHPVVITGGEDAILRIWDPSTGMHSGSLAGHEGAVYAVSTIVLPDGRVRAVSGGEDGTVRYWDLASGTQVGDPLVGHDDAVTAVATVVLPDGDALAVTGGGDTTVRVWDLAAGAQVGGPLRGHNRFVASVAAMVLPDGRLIAVSGSSETTVIFWDLAAGTQIGEPLADPGYFMVPAVATAVFPDGRPVAIIGSEDGTLRIWDLNAGTQIGNSVNAHPGGVLSVATGVLPDGRTVAVTCGDDATVRAWDLAAIQPVRYPLHITEKAARVAVCAAGDALLVAVGGPGLAALEFRACGDRGRA